MAFTYALDQSYFLRSTQAPLETTLRSDEIKVSLFPRWYHHISLEWSVPASWGDVVFNVYFSETAEFEFRKLTAQPLHDPFFADTTTREFSKTNHSYYVVEAILLDRDGIAVRSKPISWGSSENGKMRRFVELRSIEIQRREYWLLSRFNGIKSYLFRRKNYGKRCTVCWNSKTEKVMDDRCPVCLGTSFEGGYFKPVNLYVNYEPTPLVRQNSYSGVSEDAALEAWTISIPEIRDLDVIVRTSDWAIFQVHVVAPTELQTRPVRQRLRLNQLSRSEVEFELVKRNLPDFPVELF